MKNMGPVSQRWLAEIEIYTREDLEAVGAVPSWAHLKARYPKRVTKNLLWALLGAQLDMDWRELPDEVKQAALDELARIPRRY
ncbi:MAG: TfoX/Sxy family DNA transformation protein [Leptolyngbyaceae cyanobacterium MO_188.B28]|nr:TfoX/Sxy family DNA transformation protein [Leptolyngbyaceae cyanobacterium MO_188.B28]